MKTILDVSQEPLLAKVFQLSQEWPRRTLIRDLSDNFRTERTVKEFLYDVLTVENRLYDSLNEEAREKLHRSDPDAEVFIGALVSVGYSFRVLAFAIYCLGLVIIPLGLLP